LKLNEFYEVKLFELEYLSACDNQQEAEGRKKESFRKQTIKKRMAHTHECKRKAGYSRRISFVL